MKTILLLTSLLVASHSFADTFKLKKAFSTYPVKDPQLTQIWEECINQATEVTFASGYSYLANSNAKCAGLGLDNVPFKQNGDRFFLELPAGSNPFAQLKNAKVTLYAFYKTTIANLRLDSRSTFVPALTLDVRLSTTQDGVPYDYFISQRAGAAGWEKIQQALVSTQTRTEFCRPNIECTYTIKTYEQTWKDNRTGQITKLSVSESN